MCENKNAIGNELFSPNSLWRWENAPTDITNFQPSQTEGSHLTFTKVNSPFSISESQDANSFMLNYK